MRTTTKRAMAAAAGTLALAGGALVIPGIANAQVSDPTFVATPNPVTIGETLTFSVTGCIGESYPLDQIYMAVTTAQGQNFVGLAQPDAEGNASFALPIPNDPNEAGTFPFEATCYQSADNGQTTVGLVDYDSITVTIAAPTPTTVAPTPTTAAPAAAQAATTSPAFTG